MERPMGDSPTFPIDPDSMSHDTLRHSYQRDAALEQSKEMEDSGDYDDDNNFTPVRVGDREELSRIASSILTHVKSFGTDAERQDTLTGIGSDDPVLDPSSDKFDHYKWARMIMRLLDEEGIQRHETGIAFRNLNVSGSGSALQLQSTVLDPFLAPFRARELLRNNTPEKQILHEFDGLLKSGELLIVLGRPGSGCSTLLKTMCGQLHGLKMNKGSDIHFKGVTYEQMIKEYKGEITYNQEVDRHFPHLTVGETLEFAAAARTPQHRIKGHTREEYIKSVVDVTMAVFGLSHTYNTKVGDDFVRGVSGGERKRVSIAEMSLSRSRFAAWDNSTRGLDAATALEFVKALRLYADLGGSCHAVAIYQASQAIYDIFDKAIVLYEGHEIFYGPCSQAVQYFERMGWERPQRQVSGDFLTSITNPQERKARKGMENKVPRTPSEFETHWKESQEYAILQREIAQYKEDYPLDGPSSHELAASKRDQQAKHTRPQSPYIISVPMQVKLCTKRAYQRLRNDMASTLSTVISQIALSLIIGSVFYNTPDASAGFFQKGAVLFFAVLMNALIGLNEITLLYAQRPIVEKQTAYAFVHPFTEALAGIVSDLPIKFFRAAVFSIVLYFMVNLRREPSQFFIFFMFLFMAVVTMSSIFRSLAAMTKSVGQAMALAGVMVIAIVVYTGFTLPQPYMHPWFSWLRWINPVYYIYEALITNEFHGRKFECSTYVPSYDVLNNNEFICSVTGAVAGQRYVSGDSFVEQNYEYYYSHIWRNFGIIIAFMIAFTVLYLVASEINSSTESKAEFLIFRRGHVPAYMERLNKSEAIDEIAETQVTESTTAEGNTGMLAEQHDVFTWRNLCYDIPTKDGTRRLLDNVSGWVRPGTLTALMGVSGAGKTTLLDVLAQRVSIGVITGDMLVNGRARDSSFQRKTGYVQQQDLHLETSTVREALCFSANLRQPKSVPQSEKDKHVEDVIKMLGMQDFAEAVVGLPGEGLNVEQRKLLTIGVELAAKPALLIFLDEPTSGLDSQSSWAICAFLRKLADNGQAVLSTIHQPSALLFQEFDRLLFLAKGGKTVYFGDIGKQSSTLLNYFESNGARHCEESENPAEYMLEIIGAGASGKATKDWHAVWKESEQAKSIQTELDRIHVETASRPETSMEDRGEFAMPIWSQIKYVTIRVFQQYYRQPDYIFAKLMLGIVSALFIGFSFWMPNSSQQGFQDVLFSLFLLCTIFSTLVNQIMPKFITQRALYEVRERPSKAYSWKAFILAQIVAEIPWQILLGICSYASFYFPVFGANQSSLRQGTVLLFVIQFFIFASTFAQLVISALPDEATGGMIATFMFGLSLTFNGVLQPPDALPGFWIFMYRVSPLTYYIGGIAGTALSGRQIVCSDRETSVFQPPSTQTCGQYLEDYLQSAPGRLYNPDATSDCEYCALSNADQYLAARNIYESQKWRNYGIFWAYVGFNVWGAVMLYYIFRVRRFSLGKFLKGLRRVKKN